MRIVSRSAGRNLLLALIAVCAPLNVYAAAASGLGVSLPLVGRLAGGGGIVYKTAVDVTNNSTAASQVDFYVDGVDASTGAVIGIVGSLTTTGFTSQGSGTIGSKVNVHFDDFVQSLANAGLISSDALSHGFIGSAMFVFNNLTKSGQGSATARFYNPLNNGTVGVALKGHEITTNESQTLVATLQDTRSNTSGAPQIYSNVFLNNTGLTPAGSSTADSVTIQLTAYAGSTGQQVGNQMSVTIAAGKTLSLGTVMTNMAVPSSESSVVLVAKVTSGGAAIEGLISQVDNNTKDGSAFEMGRGE